MEKKEKLYEGKAKIIYKTDQDGLVIQHFKDDATAFDGEKKDTVMGKGVANNNISSKMFKLVEKAGIKTHFVKKLSDNEMLVKNVEIIQVETIVRNISAGSFCRKYGVEEGIVFEKPTVEFSYKSDEHHDPLMNDDHIRVMGLATEKEVETMRTKALEINEILKKFFASIGITVVDFKLEFGRHNGEVLLADEISPDTCRFWDNKTKKKLDKDRFRFDLGGVEETYAEMMKRIGG
ncbi:MAG: phosphoribosylaminoimidazolesuccinocarboxamide synthase [Fidelibacterota bacterium]